MQIPETVGLEGAQLQKLLEHICSMQREAHLALLDGQDPRSLDARLTPPPARFAGPSDAVRPAGGSALPRLDASPERLERKTPSPKQELRHARRPHAPGASNSPSPVRGLGGSLEERTVNRLKAIEKMIIEGMTVSEFADTASNCDVRC